VGVTPENPNQSRPADTNPATLVTAQQGEAIEGFINVCNVSGVEATARVFIDEGGATYDETTAVQWDVEIIPTQPAFRFGPYTIKGPTARIGIRSSVGNALNFTFSKLVKT
jgi:hypothetical protein